MKILILSFLLVGVEGFAGRELQEANENVKIEKENIHKAHVKKRDSEAQVELDKATIKRHEVQLQEHEDTLKKEKKKDLR